jgi:hypothetical protein
VMEKYLSPYKRQPSHSWERWGRYDLSGDIRLWVAKPLPNNGWSNRRVKDWYINGENFSSLPNDQGFDTKEEAMEALDRWLVEQGYVLLTEEQWEKLVVLV